ncbi:hypothetical protein ETD83_26735 [Actinomadura soli]|uniref:MinD-like ATPase involved in chromosome partitioning or flagellar assembly n=1 Tax=Actinomadura soli TaxID=2508997 RepID=A0A5C4J5T9_9ACTN|nr:hypothetical protein [Actinomadura soli]TMQ92740.1 hypothetical protein ETD83_26735 [Actinomadura soli]
MTTTALGLALTWPGRVLVAECDPMGRRVLPGYMADRMRESAGPGLLGLAMAAEADQHGPLALDEYVVPIVDDGRVELLHGVRDPRHGIRLAPLWQRLAAAFAARDGDVVADLGQVGGTDTPHELLGAADAVVMVLRPTLPQVDAATPRLDALKGLLGERAAIRLCLIADGAYRAAEVERALGVAVLAELPCSPSDARVLSDGTRPRLTFKTSLLMRSLNGLGGQLRGAVPGSTSGVFADLTPRSAVPAVIGGGQ